MLETSKKLTKIGEEINMLFVKNLSEPDTFMEMNSDEFKLTQLFMSYINESNKLMIETAELLERVDKNVLELASK